MENHVFSLGFIESLNSRTNHKFRNALNPLRFSTNMPWAFLSAFQNHWFSLGFIEMLNSWTNHKFRNALNPLRFFNKNAISFSISFPKPVFSLLKSTIIPAANPNSDGLTYIVLRCNFLSGCTLVRGYSFRKLGSGNWSMSNFRGCYKYFENPLQNYKLVENQKPNWFKYIWFFKIIWITYVESPICWT